MRGRSTEMPSNLNPVIHKLDPDFEEIKVRILPAECAGKIIPNKWLVLYDDGTFDKFLKENDQPKIFPSVFKTVKFLKRICGKVKCGYVVTLPDKKIIRIGMAKKHGQKSIRNEVSKI